MNGTGYLSCLVILVAFNVGLWKLRFTKTGETIVFNAGRISRILGFELLNPLIWQKDTASWGTQAQIVKGFTNSFNRRLWRNSQLLFTSWRLINEDCHLQ